MFLVIAMIVDYKIQTNRSYVQATPKTLNVLFSSNYIFSNILIFLAYK